MEIKEERLEKELKQANISLILASYQDIFSNFDSRSFSEKALSDDFLIECKRAAREKELGIELILGVPNNKRNLNDEFKIKKRLREHFHKHYLEKERAIKSLKKQGWIWVFMGSILMILATFIETYTQSFLLNLILTIIIPASWFGFWEGLGKVFIESKEDEPEFIFYKKMTNAEISFRSY